jgi:hypothetical protein
VKQCLGRRDDTIQLPILSGKGAGRDRQLVCVMNVGKANQVGEDASTIDIRQSFTHAKQLDAVEFLDRTRGAQAFSDHLAGYKNDFARLLL